MMSTGMTAIRYVMCHPVLANLLLVCVLFTGAMGVRKLAIHQTQDPYARILSVRIEWENANIVEVQDSLTVPLVNAFMTLGSFQSLESYSRAGESYVQIFLRPGADTSKAFDEIRNLLTGLDLPAGVGSPVVIEEFHHEPLMRLILYSNDIENLRYWSAESRRMLLAEYLMDNVKLSGLTDRDLNVRMQLADLHRLQVPIAQVAHSLSDASNQMPMGRVETDDFVMSVRSEDKPRTTEALSVQTLHLQGHAYQLSDIAEVAQENDPADPVLMYQGQPAVMLTINRQAHSSSSNQALVKRFYQWYNMVQTQWPESINTRILWQDYQLIEKQLSGLVQFSMLGCVLATLSLVVWLPWRLALSIGVSIPVAMLTALNLMQFWQVSLNLVSLMTLWVISGFVVQQIVMIVEYAWSNWQRGSVPERALLQACDEHKASFLTGPFVLLCALCPLAILPLVITGWYMAILYTVLPVVFATLGVVLLLMPHQIMQALTLTHKRSQRRQSDDWRDAWQHSWHYWQFFALKKKLHDIAQYAWILCAVWLVFLLMPWVLLTTGHLNSQALPDDASQKMAFDVSFYAATPQAAMQQAVADVEQTFRTLMTKRPWRKNRVKSVLVQYLLPGTKETSERVFDNGIKNHASILIELDHPLTAVKRQKIQAQLRQSLPPSTAIESIQPTQVDHVQGTQTFDLVVQGDDWSVVTENAPRIAEQLRSFTGVGKVTSNLPPSEFVYQMKPKPAAALLGVSKQSLAAYMSDALNGNEVLINHQSGGKKQTIRVQALPQHVDSEADLSSMPVHINGKQMVLGDIAEWKLVENPRIYYQYNGLPAVKLRVVTQSSVASSTLLRHEIMRAWQAGLGEKFSVRLIDLTVANQGGAQQKAVLSGVVIAFALVYFVLAWSTRSYVWPVSLLLAAVSSSSAILWSYCLTGSTVTQLTWIAALGLISIVLPQLVFWHRQYFLCRQHHLKLGITETVVKAICLQFRATVLSIMVLTLCWLPLLFSYTSLLQAVRSVTADILWGWYLTCGLMLFGWPALAALYEQYIHRAPRVKT